ncbi:MAG TPA: hypothetical protein VF893_06020 [Candidatus Bathyarchaeia archaeon]
MKRQPFYLLTPFLGLLILASFSIGIQPILAQTQDGESYSYGLNILSPANTAYSPQSLILNVTIKRMFSPSEYDSKIMYSLNGDANITVPSTTAFIPMDPPSFISSAIGSYTFIAGAVSLPMLSEGSYRLTVYGIYVRAMGISSNYPALMHDTQTIDFVINDGVAPLIANLQIENTTYTQNSLPLNFTVDEPICWIGYSLDGKRNVTVTENVTLNELAYGSHVLVVYANDTVGNMGTTGSIDFTVAKPESFPVVPIALTVSIIAVAASVGLLFYFKKCKQ